MTRGSSMMTLRTFAASAVLSLAPVAARVLAKTAAPKPSGAIIVDETDVGLLFGGQIGGGEGNSTMAQREGSP